MFRIVKVMKDQKLTYAHSSQSGSQKVQKTHSLTTGARHRQQF